MKYVNYEKTVVIVANDVNISIFKPWWLIKNGIINEQEIISENVFISPVAVSIPTVEFGLGIFPNRIQMAFHPHSTHIQEDINRIAGQIVKKLPHTPYTGIGLNFNYFISPEQAEFYEWNKIHFASSCAKRLTLNQEAKPKYGSYFSFDILDSRLKLDIKPIVGNVSIPNLDPEWSQGQDLIRANFNFHYDINIEQDSIDKVVRILNSWTDAQKKSEQIVNQLTN